MTRNIDIIVLGHPFGPEEAVGGAEVRVGVANDAIRDRKNRNYFLAGLGHIVHQIYIRILSYQFNFY